MRSKTTGLLAFAMVVFLSGPSLFAQVVIQRCDVTTGWEGNEALSIDNIDKKEGRGSLMTEAVTGQSTWFSKSFSQTRTGIDNSGYLSFWMYVSDASLLEGGLIGISSSGAPDTNESTWPLEKSMLVDGWNHLLLPLDQSVQSGGGVSLDRVNFFRITQDLSGPITVKIDFIRFAPKAGEPSWPELNVPEVDNTSLDGKVMFGYQGWFNHPDDGAGLPWTHWGNYDEPIESDVDMYPDLREYGLDELYDTDLTFPDGRMAPVFSSYHRSTVVRHMKWVRDYNLDGVFVQRFISEADERLRMDHKDSVTRHVMAGCENYGRVFSIMYDGIANRVEEIKADWIHLVDEIGVTGSDRYLNHRELPLVALWGYTVRADATADQLVELISWFKNNPEPRYRASLLLGVADDWYEQDPIWMNAFQDVEVISPWFSGDTDYDLGQAWCDAHNVDFLPVVHPGFSWYNLHAGEKNDYPREGGSFLWNEVKEVVSKNAKSVYIAMFDEVDEATAMFKLAENRLMIPKEGYWLPLDADGYQLPSDWYLRIAGLVTEVVRGYEDNHASLVTPPKGIMSIRIINEVNDNDQGGMEFIFPDFPDETSVQISIDSGSSYDYTTPDDVGSFTISPLSEGRYQVFVRHGAGSEEVHMGEVYIGNSIEVPPAMASEPYPADGEVDVRTEVTMGWKEGEHAHSHIIYLGKSNPPDSVNTQASSTYKADELEPNTTYYWRVDEVNAFGRADGPVWSFTTGSENSGDVVVLDYCDSYAGWNVVNIDTEEKKEGYASLMSDGRNTDWFKRKFTIPVNTYCDSNSYFDLWLYVSDVSKFEGGGQLEITSAGGPDEEEYNWAVSDLNLSNGWNELHLQISTANKMGEPDLSGINFFRLYQFVSGDVLTRIDFIRFSDLAYEALSAPVNLTATSGDGEVSLDWDDNAEASVVGYNVYRANIQGWNPTKLNTEPVPESFYTDHSVSNGGTYYYVVRATDRGGNESDSSEEIAGSPEGSTSVSILSDVGAKIYPNPLDDLLHIRVENGRKARMLDLSGRMVKSVSLGSSETTLEVNDLEAGVYLIELTTSEGIGMFKLIKK